jgi:hypothetical protein
VQSSIKETLAARSMYPLSLAMAVIVPALLLVEYGLIKTRQPLLCEGLWGGFVAGVAVGVAVIAWELAFSWLLPLGNLPPVRRSWWSAASSTPATWPT